MSEALRLPSIHRGPVRRIVQPDFLERCWRWTVAPLITLTSGWRARRLRPAILQTLRLESNMQSLSDAELQQRARDGGLALRRRDHPRQRAELFAVLRETAARTLGLRAYAVQIQGAMALWSGNIVEMATGEGKTLAAALAAAAAALTGQAVHVVTVNDYLATRDGHEMAPLFDFLGLEVATVVNETPADERPACYRAPVVYVSNKELGFDFLRDRVAESGGHTVAPIVAGLTGGAGASLPRIPTLTFAIVDEADSVLVDEARTPLILSGEAESELDQATCELALETARALVETQHYHLDGTRRQVRLSKTGRRWLDDRFATAADRWASPVYREETVTQALAALWLFERDHDYLVREGKVEIVDEFTGRTMPDRSWRMGLHQLIETKEGLELTPPRLTLGHITYQSLFRRYRRLSGMSGTVAEIANELWQVFTIPTLRIPPHRPSRRKILPNRVFLTTENKLTTVVQRVAELHRCATPVLVGTRTVGASQELADRLRAQHIEFSLLNAAQDADEAAIIARAGEAGQITIATNMAGRGTDIRLTPEAQAVGGLHVLMTERHEAARIDRQLAGRCARQGDPGVFQAFLSLEDDIVATSRLPVWLRVALHMARHVAFVRDRLVLSAQRHLERTHARTRRRIFLAEDRIDRILALTGTRE